jgi:hypothetical protein
MEQLEFKDWLKDLERYHDKKNDNGLNIINEIKWTLNGFSKEKRTSFINELIKHNEKFYAKALIPIYGSKRQKMYLKIHLFFGWLKKFFY